MWKKDDTPEQVPVPRTEPVSSYERQAYQKPGPERATIGRSITINGQVTGEEDLLIQGRVEGSVMLKQHAVTVGPEGEIKADITSRVITVEGRVEGNLDAQEQVILRGSAIVEGNITAPRVVLEDGARFRGGVDMGETPKVAARGAATPAAAAQPASKPAAGSELDVGTRAAAAGSKDAPTQPALSAVR